jgi:hypothetical protein
MVGVRRNRDPKSNLKSLTSLDWINGPLGFSRSFLLERGFAVLRTIWFFVLMPETSGSENPIVSVQDAAERIFRSE